MRKFTKFSLLAIFLVATFVYAQQKTRTEQILTNRQDGLDPKNFDPAVDPDIDMFINNWKNSMPRIMYGNLVFRDILTKLEGTDPLHPKRKGAVLNYMTAFSYATLEPGASAGGRAQKGEQQTFYVSGGTGVISVNSKANDIKKGMGFILTPDFDFKLTGTGKEQLTFYVRTEPLAADYKPSAEFVMANRFDNDRRVGAHWAHIGNGGIRGMSLITIAPRTIPQPHSHGVGSEECWAMVEKETVLLFGKQILRMTPGSAYKIPPTGITAHTNINMGDEPVQMIFFARNDGQSGQRSPMDYDRLDNNSYNRATEPDIDMFMGNWRDSFPRIMHGNLYFRDMLTALEGPDDLHPTRKGACLVNAQAVSYGILESGSAAHKVEGELNGIQQTFVVNSGAGIITSGTKTVELAKGMAFIITPGLDFRLKATGDEYMTFYVTSEKLPPGFAPKKTLEVVDNRGGAPSTVNWAQIERRMIAKDDGMSQFGVLTEVKMDAMTMSRPYSAGKGVEEIWIATEGDIELLFGKQLRKLPVGTAYRIPSTGITAHSNINATGNMIKLIHMKNQ